MAKVNSKNNDLLRDTKQKVSPKVYSILLELVNDNKENLAEVVLKIDYLIEYANNSIKAKDRNEAKETLQMAEERMKLLRREQIDISYLEYLIDGVKKKIK